MRRFRCASAAQRRDHSLEAKVPQQQLSPVTCYLTLHKTHLVISNGFGERGGSLESHSACSLSAASENL